MKAILISVVLLTVSSGIFIGVQNNQKEACIEDWYAHTSQLFQSASSFFSSKGSTSDEVEALDLKLQALLPDDNIDLSYHSDEQSESLSMLSTAPKQALLPNLFDISNDPTTKLKGQVFTDDEDNIVGAELNLSIPTDIR